MEWLNLDWIVANWMPLAVFALLGYILAWLVLARPASNRAGAAEARSSELEGKVRKSESDLAALKRESDPLKQSLASAQSERDAALAKATALQESLSASEEEKARIEATLVEKEALLAAEAEAMSAEIEMQDEASIGEGEEFAVLKEGEVELFDVEVPEPTPDEPGAPAIAAVFGAVARQIESPSPYEAKDIALSEAYARVTVLQRDLADRDNVLSQRESELESVRSELLAAQAARQELESRLIRAREDVASELAVLASTMIKMKDDQLARSDARMQALETELENLRTATLQATETAE